MNLTHHDPADAPRPLSRRDGEGPADEEEPGFWAQAALANPWMRGHRNSQNASTRLYALRENGLYREPVLRASRSSYDGPAFHRLVGWRSENVEALLAQATGAQVVPDQACNHCQRGQGLFTSCVVVPGRLLECANCHWAGQGHRCSFRDQAPTEYVPLRQGDVERRLRELRETRENLMAQLLQVDQEISQLSSELP